MNLNFETQCFFKGYVSVLDCFSSLGPNEHCPEWVNEEAEAACVLQMRAHKMGPLYKNTTRFRQIQGWLKQYTHPLRVKESPSLSYCWISKTK
jgi:hypothetical protein